MHNHKTTLKTSNGQEYSYYSLPLLAKSGFNLNKLPISIRIVLEAVLRNCDGIKITPQHVEQLATWQPQAKRTAEIPFVVARVVLQDFTGVPLLCDLAAMRDVAKSMQHDPKRIEPLVPVDLVIDHSVQVDHYGSSDAVQQNMELEFKRNAERYQFLKWGMQAFKTFQVVPPGAGIIHQINLEYLFRGVQQNGNVIYPDTLVGTDSHTTMINGVGVVGWGVGGIEAEAAMLGQPLYLLTPDVVGVELRSKLNPGVTATDLVLTVTQILRAAKVVGKFVEFFGDGATSLSVTDRATIANMAPEYGATMGYFPVDEATVKYMQMTGKTVEQVELFEQYFKAQGLFGMPKSGDIEYSQIITIDLSTVKPSLAGPKRPQDRIDLEQMRQTFTTLFSQQLAENGFNKNPTQLFERYPTALNDIDIGNGDVLIAAITSCTNTSNPSVLVAAGLLAKKAVTLGLTVHQRIKTSLAPGSKVVTQYLQQSGLMQYLDQLGFNIVGYGCTTCIGNSGDLAPELLSAINQHDLIGASVLSGNRNFEARIHPALKANYLASPPLVIAFALAGTVNIDLSKEPLSYTKDGKPVFLADIWPTTEEINEALVYAQNPAIFRDVYHNLAKDNQLWDNIIAATGETYNWPESTYIERPPFFTNFAMQHGKIGGINGAKALLIVGDSVTTDHISPAGSFKANSPAGGYLIEHGVAASDFNSYGSRRGNHEIMMRGTFANVRIKNLMLPIKDDGSRIEGGFTLYNGQVVDIYSAAMQYKNSNIPTIVLAGEEYGTGSSRDWAAKGPQLLGVRVVLARSFERIHRSNLVGMGVLPLQFTGDDSVVTLNLTGAELYDVLHLDDNILPQQNVAVRITYQNGTTREIKALLRIDTAIEVEYYKHGGILPFVLRQLLI